MIIGSRLLLCAALVVTVALEFRAHAGAQRHSDAVDDELTAGRRALREGDNFKALSRYRRANELEGNRCADCLLGMAEAMLAMKTYPNALETTALLLRLDGVTPAIQARAHALRGEIFAAAADTDATQYRDAEKELREAIALDADDDYLHYQLGLMLLKQQRESEGVAALQAFLSRRDLGPTAQHARDLIANPRRGYLPYIPDFSLVSPDGIRFTPESLRGKVVLFDFWASWCEPCRRALPELRKLQQTHANDAFMLISIGGDEDDGVWRRFTVKNNMLAWPQLWDRGEVRTRFNVKAFPTYVLVDRDGVEKMRGGSEGFHRARALRDAIEKELAR